MMRLQLIHLHGRYALFSWQAIPAIAMQVVRGSRRGSTFLARLNARIEENNKNKTSTQSIKKVTGSIDDLIDTIASDYNGRQIDLASLMGYETFTPTMPPTFEDHSINPSLHLDNFDRQPLFGSHFGDDDPVDAVPERNVTTAWSDESVSQDITLPPTAIDPMMDRMRLVQIELKPFQILYTMPMSNGHQQEMSLLHATKEHVSSNLNLSEESFVGVDMVELMREESAHISVDSMTMMAYKGTAFFNKSTSKEYIQESVLLAFLGVNMTQYTTFLRESGLPVEKAQLYTMTGDMVLYSNGVMNVTGDFPEEADMMSMTSIWMYIVAIGVPSFVCCLICMGYCSYSFQGYSFCQPKGVDPEDQTWHNVPHNIYHCE